jgi:excisionase family DNA binding protein
MSWKDLSFLSVRDWQDITRESEACIRKRLSRGEIPYIKMGANVRIRREDFEKWLEERTVRGGERHV